MGIVKPLNHLSNISSIITFINSFPIVKKFSIEEKNNRTVIVKVLLPWWYLWPFSFFLITRMQTQADNLTLVGFNILI